MTPSNTHPGTATRGLRRTFLQAAGGLLAARNRRRSADRVRARPWLDSLEDRLLLTTPPPGIIAWWTGDGTAADSAGGNHGTLVNGATYGPGKIGQAFSFDGVDDFVQAPDSDLWAFGDDDFTINLWANFDVIESSTIGHPQVVFIGNDEGSGSQNKWTFAFGGETLHFHVNTPSGGEFIAAGHFTPSVDRWYHLAVTRSGSVYTTYVDGAPVASETNTRTVPNATAPLTIGQSESPPEDLFMDGRLDEVQIYNRALTPAEIAELADPLRVINTNDSGPGSLRQALAYAATNPGADTITFTIPANDPNHVYYKDDGIAGQVTHDATHVVPTTAADDAMIGDIDPDWAHSWWSIPTLSNLVVDSAVTIDGYTQAGSSRNTLADGDDAVLRIELDGGAGPFNGAVVLAADGGALQGMAINRFGYTGAQLNAATTVRGCFIGTDPSGTVALPNGHVGVESSTATSRVGVDGNGFDDTGGGLDDYAERNLISGNGVMGVRGPGVVAGNFIGTDRTGRVALPNGQVQAGPGVEAHPGSRIGVDTHHANPEAERNIISGNRADGVAAYAGSVVAGNYIGIDATGTQPLGNSNIGVLCLGGAIIGTNGDGEGDELERNIISANANQGVYASGENNHIAGNYIGTNADGSAAVGAQPVGVLIDGYGSNNHVGLDPADSSPGRAAKRNVISGNSFQNVSLSGTGNTVAGNYIGLDPTGSRNLSSNLGGFGVHIHSGQANLVGTDSDGVNDDLERNVISGVYTGVEIVGGNDHVVAGNYIGTDKTGTVLSGPGPDGRVGNGFVGIELHYSVSGSRLGVNPDATNPLAGRNVIAGHSGAGIRLLDRDVSNNVIAGNYIGTDWTGMVALPNALGVVSLDATSNTIGGTTAAERNLISGNGVGVYLIWASANNRVLGNWIGTDATGSAALGYYGTGVAFEDSASGNQIGGTAPGEANTIAFNGLAVGVARLNSTATGNTIRGNSIHDNLGLGIDLAHSGVTANDTFDADIGPNGLQNFPVLATVRGGGSTRVTGTLHSTPNATFTIDLYASSAADPSGYGEGELYLGYVEVTTDSNGDAGFDVTVASATAVGDWITATATGAEGTSEFSLAVEITNTPPVASAGGPYFVVRGGSVQLDASASFDSDQSSSTLTYEWDLDSDGQFDDATGILPAFSAEGIDALGTVTIAVRVTDDAGASHVAQGHVTIVALALIPSPVVPGMLDLVVGGTSHNDLIAIGRGLTTGQWYASITSPTPTGPQETLVIVNPCAGGFQLEFSVDGITVSVNTITTSDSIGRVVAYGQAGDDVIWATALVQVPAWLHGGAGDDKIKGGSGDDALLGGAGDDLLVGGAGRDLMIGGTGADRLVGDVGDDLIIAGYTAYDAMDNALAAIMAEWTSARSYDDRVRNLRGDASSPTFAARANGETYLAVDDSHGRAVMVFDDGVKDTLTGNGGQDWFLFNADGDDQAKKDKVTDLSAAEFADDLEFITGP